MRHSHTLFPAAAGACVSSTTSTVGSDSRKGKRPDFTNPRKNLRVTEDKGIGSARVSFWGKT